jgi:cysteine desulfurase family protein (TIGR01976 family)
LARQQDGRAVAFFDGPAGSQMPQRVIDAVAHYLAHTNANTHGEFATSRASDELLAEAHRGVADFLGADDPQCVVFGANMTTLTLALSRAIGRTWRPGDEVLVTRSDHDANVTPWVLAARDAGAVVHQVHVQRGDCTLDLDDLRRKLTARTRLVAVGAASNATGTVHPVRTICDLAHEAGAEVFVDAVHYAPHVLIDVQALGCDYLACSAYKFFGPHVGVLWGRRERLEALPAYKLRAAPDDLPDRWMTGTQNHEGIAGTLAAVEYLADIGRRCGCVGGPPRDSQPRQGEPRPGAITERRVALRAAYQQIEHYERQLLARLLKGLREMPEITVHGITDPARLAERVPTVCFTHARHAPREIARRLAAEGIYVWHGNYYALPLTETLGLEPQGAVRVGLLHYNTAGEVDRLLVALDTICGVSRPAAARSSG